METMTSSFPSSTRGENDVQLDRIIFYSGPESAKTRKASPSDADGWLNVDVILAEAAKQEWVAGIERSDPTGDFEIMGEDIRNIADIRSAAQAATSTAAHLENVSTPFCNPFDDSRGGGDSESPGPLDVWGRQIESVPAGTSHTVQPEVQHNCGDVGTTAPDYPLDDGASLALWEALRGEGSIFAPATNIPTSSPRTPKPDGPDLPVHTLQPPPGGPDIDMALSDKSPLEEGDRVQRLLLTDDREHNSASPTALESSANEREDTSRVALSISANTAASEGSTCDRARISGSAATTDAAHTESSDSDGQPLTRRRRRTRPRNRGSHSPSPPLTPRSSAPSVEAKSTTALRRRRRRPKRLGQRKEMRRDSPTPESDDTSTSLPMSMSSGRGGDRWTVQCVVERKTIGSQEVITIQVPAIDLCASRICTQSPSDDTSQTPPIQSAARRVRRRARFSQAEEDLLVKLKAQREPKLSWREIQRHFPRRTTGSLQVHYSTHLKGRRAPEQPARRPS